MKEQVFYPSWILRIVVFLCAIGMFVALFSYGLFASEKLFFRILAFLGAVIFGVGGIVVTIKSFPVIIVTHQYIKIGSQHPIEWKYVSKIERLQINKNADILLISYFKLDTNSEERVVKRRSVMLNCMHNPKKLIQAVEQCSNMHLKEVRKSRFEALQTVYEENLAQQKK